MPKREIYFPEEGKIIILTGTVSDKKYRTAYGSRTAVLYLSHIEEEKTKKAGGFRKKDTIVMCCLTDTAEEDIPAIDETVRVRGKVSLFRKATNPGEFDLREYYQILNISYRCNQTEILARSGTDFPFKEQLFQLKCRLSEILGEIYPEKEASVLRAMLLGEKSGLEEEIKELYQLNGMIHILSISGLHISLLGTALYRLMKKCFFPLWIRVPVVTGLMWCYGIMTGMGVSTERAVFMFMLYLSAELLGRTYDMLTALALTAVMMLIKQPLLVRHSGFLLSFGAVLGIATVLPWWKDTAEGLFHKNRLKKKPGSLSADRDAVKKLVGRVWEGLILSTAIAIATLPVLLYFYYSYPIYSLLLNLLIIPLTGVVLVDGMISMGIGFFWIRGAVFSGLPGRLILWFYEYCCEKFLMFPGSIKIGGRPAAWQILLYYAVLIFLIVWHYFDEEAEGRSEVPPFGRWMLLLGMIQFLFLRPFGGFTAWFIDVGQGDCIVIRNENGNCYMVDGGSTDKSRTGTYQILPFLKSEGIGELEAVFVTHPDEDHISGVLEMMEQSDYGVKIKKLILPDAAQEIKERELYDLRRTAALSRIPVSYIGRDDALWDKNLKMICLGPQKGILTEEMNEISIVLYLSYGDFSMLLTGDVTGAPEEELLTEWEKSGISGRLTVLKAAHHGSRYSTPEELLRLTKPACAIISAGKDNRYGHPHEELTERLKENGCLIYSTIECGAIRCRTDGKSVKFSCYLKEQ